MNIASKAVVFLGLAAVLFLVPACDRPSGQGKTAETAPAARETFAVPVDVVEVRRGDIHRVISATGTANAWLESHLAPKIGGRVQSIHVREGDAVARGAALFQLEQSDLILARQAAQAQLNVARAQLEESRVHLASVGRERERFNRLFEKNAISQQKNDEINSAFLMAESRVELATANLAAAATNLDLAVARLGDSVVRAPFSGIVFRKNINVAEMVAPGVPLISLMNIDRLKLEVDIPERHSREIRIGMPVEITIDALGGTAINAELSAINPRVNPQSRNFRVEIAIPNREHRIKPGMFCRVRIKTDRISDVPVLPLRAVLTGPKGESYLILTKDNRSVRREIQTGGAGEELVAIKSGIDVGEMVLISGNYGIEEGVLLAPRTVVY